MKALKTVAVALGITLGALIVIPLVGALADRIGRRGAVLGCTVWFSVFTALLTPRRVEQV